MAAGLSGFLAKLLDNRRGDGGDLKPPQLRKIAWLVVAGLVGAVILAVGFSPGLQSPSGTPAKPLEKAGEGAAAVTSAPGALASDEASLEQKLAEALSQVEGAGRVIVKVTFATGRAYDYAENTTREDSSTREQESGGLVRETSEVRTSGEVVTSQERTGGLSVPVVRSVMEPRVQGVLVVSDGAGDPRLREAITEAVTTLLAIPPHRVSVLPRER